MGIPFLSSFLLEMLDVMYNLVDSFSSSSWCKKELGVFAHVILTCFVIRSAKTKSGSVKKDEAVRTLVMHPSESCLNSNNKGAMLVLELNCVDAVEDYFDSFPLYCKFAQGSCDQITSQALALMVWSRYFFPDNQFNFIDILI